MSAHEPTEIRSIHDLAILFERISPSSLAARLDPRRPYDGQSHTMDGERGKTEIHGITFRSLVDAFVAACYLSSGLPVDDYPGSVYDLPWDEMDPMAIGQNLCCEIERYMGIYPNLPPEVRA